MATAPKAKPSESALGGVAAFTVARAAELRGGPARSKGPESEVSREPRAVPKRGRRTPPLPPRPVAALTDDGRRTDAPDTAASAPDNTEAMERLRPPPATE